MFMANTKHQNVKTCQDMTQQIFVYCKRVVQPRTFQGLQAYKQTHGKARCHTTHTHSVTNLFFSFCCRLKFLPRAINSTKKSQIMNGGAETKIKVMKIQLLSWDPLQVHFLRIFLQHSVLVNNSTLSRLEASSGVTIAALLYTFKILITHN